MLKNEKDKMSSSKQEMFVIGQPLEGLTLLFSFKRGMQ